MHRNFCPFEVVKGYIKIRGNYETPTEQLFIFSDGSPVKPNHARDLLKKLINKLGLDAKSFGMHSLRLGRTSDLIKYGYTLEQVKTMGRWRSNAVYKYIKY